MVDLLLPICIHINRNWGNLDIVLLSMDCFGRIDAIDSIIFLISFY